jgi:hypothetical protein
MDTMGLKTGVKMKEIATHGNVWTNCTVLHSDAVGLVFEVQRTISEGGNVETVVSQVMVPWSNVQHVLLVEERI